MSTFERAVAEQVAFAVTKKLLAQFEIDGAEDWSVAQHHVGSLWKGYRLSRGTSTVDVLHSFQDGRHLYAINVESGKRQVGTIGAYAARFDGADIDENPMSDLYHAVDARVRTLSQPAADQVVAQVMGLE